MKLKRLIIKNFRGLKGEGNIIDFENSDIIFLIGKNNTGKSTFLRAYEFFVEPKVKASVFDFYDQQTNNPIEIIGEFLVEENDDTDKILGKEDPDWIKKWVDNNGIIKIKKVWVQVSEEGKKQTYNPMTMGYVDGGFGGFDTLLKKYSPSAIPINAISTPEDLEKQINDIITKNHIKKLETEYGHRYKNIIEGLEELKNDISKSDDINKINENMNIFFNKIFPKLELEIYSFPDSGMDISKTLKSTHGLKVKEKELLEEAIYDLKSNGHGVIRQAFFSFLSTLTTDLGKKRKEYLILFEEPELYLHPESIFSLREQLYELANNSPFQILCATHSPLMVDTSKPHSSLVRLVKGKNKNTTTYQVKFDIYKNEDKNYLQMINRFNPHICESFYSDEVILVEGDTESIIYRDLISRFYKDKKDVFILNTGSKANMVFYQKILTHFGIKHIVVHDVDSPTYMSEGKEKINAMWVFNDKIWEQVIESNQLIPNISRRFVHYKNFENAHNYKENKSKGKPLSAFEFAQTIEMDSKLPCIEFLNDVFGNEGINHSQEYIFLLEAENTKGTLV